jgi:hypothetical protein
VATALLVTAYANSINGKHCGFAVALAIAGLAITAIASASALNQATAGGKAQDALRDMEDRIAGRLDADSIRIVKHQGGIRHTPAAAGIMVGLAAALFVSALICGTPMKLYLCAYESQTSYPITARGDGV